MITSSNFFDKAFFTIENPDHKLHSDELSPWESSPGRMLLQGGKVHPQVEYSRVESRNRGYEISKSSSKRYIDQKLRAKSLLNKSREIVAKKSSSNFFTLEQKLHKLPRSKMNIEKLVEASHENYIKRKKSKILFPELSVHQYNELRAQGSGIYNTYSIDDIMERRKNRRKLLEEINKGSVTDKNRKAPKLLNQSGQGKSFLSGRYVCAVKNPEFSVHGLPTHKIYDGY